MGLPLSFAQKLKAGIHWAQALLTFINLCLSLAILKKGGDESAAVYFYFGLCWLTIPCLIYPLVVLLSTRAYRLANAYAYAVLDILCTLLWFAAFVAIAVWEAEGVSKGTKNSKETGAGSCSHFAYGSSSQCEIAIAMLAFGVLLFFTFAATSAISVNGVVQYVNTARMAKTVSRLGNDPSQAADQNQNPWSLSLQDFDPTRQLDGGHPYGQVPEASDEQLLLNKGQRKDSHVPYTSDHNMIDTLTDEGMHPGRLVTFSSNNSLPSPPDEDGELASSSSRYIPPSAFSPSPWKSPSGGRMSFPGDEF